MLREAVRKYTGGDLKDAGDYRIFAHDESDPSRVGGVHTSFIEFICPHDGCGDRCHLPVNIAACPMNPHFWHWNEERKTLDPSIQRKDPKRCEHHFSLIDGKWVP